MSPTQSALPLGRDSIPMPLEFIDETRAAQFLDLSPRTLRQLRWKGGGPRFSKFGSRVKYSLADLREWAASRTVSNTAEATALKGGDAQ